MRTLSLALCVAVLGTGCIIHDDDDYGGGGYVGPYGDVNVYWEFIRNAPAQAPDGYVVYDSSLTGTATGPCPESAVEWVRVTSAAGTQDVDCQMWNPADGVSVQGITIGNLPASTQNVRVRGYRGDVLVHDWSVNVAVPANGVVDAVVSVEPVQADAELYAYFEDALGLFGSCAEAGNPNIAYDLRDGAGTVIDQDVVGCGDPMPAFVVGGPLDLDNYTVRMRGTATTGPSAGQVVFDSCDWPFDHFATQILDGGVAVTLSAPPSCG